MSIGGKIAWVVVAALGLVGIYAGIGVKKLMSICYNIVKYKYKLDLEYLYLDLTLQLKNPSFLKVGIEGYDIDVYLNNKWVAKVAKINHEEIVAEGVSVIDIPIKIKYQKLINTVAGKEIINAFSSKNFDKIFVTLEGTFSGSVLKVLVNVPVDYKITLDEIIKIMDAPASAPC